MSSFFALPRTLLFLNPGHQGFDLVTECPRALTRRFKGDACLHFFGSDCVHLGARVMTFGLVHTGSGGLLVSLEFRNARLVVGCGCGESRFGFCECLTQTGNFLLRCIQGGSHPGHLLPKLCS